MKILICTTEFPPHGSGIANVVYMIRNRLETVEDISTYILTRQGGDINLASRIDNLPSFVGRLSFWKKAIDFIVKNKDYYDVIWLHSPLLINPTKLKCVKRLIITFHSTYFGNYNALRPYGITSRLLYYALANKIEYVFLKNLSDILRYNTMSLVTTMSPITAMQLKENGLSIDVEIILNGVDVNMFKPIANKQELRKHLGIPQDNLVFLYVGRINSVKQPFKLIKFFIELKQQIRDINLIIVGAGELSSDLEKFAITYCGKNVKFLGFVPHKELPPIYAYSDFFILSSIYEGQPMALLEAMSSGLPPIVSNIPSLKYIVNESNAGLILEFRNIEESVKKTLQFVNEENLQNQSKRARNFIEENHNWKNVVAQYIELFNIIQ